MDARLSDSEEDWSKLADKEADDQTRYRQAGSTTPIAMLNLRELARKAEEAAVVLEAAGYKALPGELMKVSERLIQIREALERLSDHPK